MNRLSPPQRITLRVASGLALAAGFLILGAFVLAPNKANADDPRCHTPSACPGATGSRGSTGSADATGSHGSTGSAGCPAATGPEGPTPYDPSGESGYWDENCIYSPDLGPSGAIHW